MGSRCSATIAYRRAERCAVYAAIDDAVSLVTLALGVAERLCSLPRFRTIQSTNELTRRFAALNHLFGIGVEGVVDDPLRGIEFVIVLIPEVPKAFGDGL
jgi:hypothetical protein